MVERDIRSGDHHQPDKAPYRPVLQSIAQSIKELRQSVDEGNSANKSHWEQAESDNSPLSEFFKAYLPIIINGLLLGVVAVQAFYAFTQWSEMRTAQRAWVVVNATGFQYITVPSTGQATAVASAHFVNTGPSPAFGARIEHCVQALDKEPQVTMRPSGACSEHYLGVMGTNVPAKLDLPDKIQQIPKDSLAIGAEPGRHLYLWGEIGYRTFTGDREHHTTFCLMNSGNMLAPCQRGNDGD